MASAKLFSLVKTVMYELPDEETIVASQRTLADRYLQLKLDPFIYANGSVPQGAYRSEELVPGRKVQVEIYKIVERAKPLQVLSFIEGREGLHLGGLGLVLIQRVLPIGLSCLAFESEDFARMTSLSRLQNGEYQFMILKDNIVLDQSDGFVCIKPVSDE